MASGQPVAQSSPFFGNSAACGGPREKYGSHGERFFSPWALRGITSLRPTKEGLTVATTVLPASWLRTRAVTGATAVHGASRAAKCEIVYKWHFAAQSG